MGRGRVLSRGAAGATATSRRTGTLAVAGFLLVLLTALAALAPVPYVVLSPGPTVDTIGVDKGKDLITIKGRRTYPAEGDLRLTTVLALGGPGSRLSLVRALVAWADDDDAVVPVESVYPRGTTRDQVEQQNAEEMQLSQEHATAAALRLLGIPVTEVVKVQSIVRGAPALGVLKAGDVVVAADGKPVTHPEDLRAVITARPAGEPVQMTVKRDGKQLAVQVPTRRGENGRAMVGIAPAVGYEFPFEVDYNLDKVGGPSAGLMFALGIVDKLTPGSMTGGKNIAGTGTIEADGSVGPIGGIQQKMHGARAAGATVFLAPARNCAEALLDVPAGLQVVKVTSLADARSSVERIARGDTAVPACTT